jgi:serine protease Do
VLRPVTLVTLSLTAILAFMLGLTTGSVRPALSPPQTLAFPPERAETPETVPPVHVPQPTPAPVIAAGASIVNFADVAARINPAVVNIESIARGSRRRRAPEPSPFDESVPSPPGSGPVRPQSGTGFVVEPDGQILTNYHVIQNADRILVKFSDGRSLQARVLGIDPDTDIALIKVDASNLPVAPLGDSEALRVGEWVCAIGNPLAYEHTVTVGVVSYLGRKLFDSSLDNYIQTDAAINFGNSGGPLINGRGEVVGINSAISQRASNIGFAVPINEARAILPKLRADGRVARGFMGVNLTDVDPDLVRSLRLTSTQGALVHDVVSGSPGQRAGLRTYDLITAIDDKRITSNNEIIREVSRRAPGTIARLQVLRDGRRQTFAVRLGERPSRQAPRSAEDASPSVRPTSTPTAVPLGLNVKEIDRTTANRLKLPNGVSGVVVTRVDPLSAGHDAGIQRDHILMEINRRPINSTQAYDRMARAAQPGDVLAVYVFMPLTEQRAIRAVRVDAP